MANENSKPLKARTQADQSILPIPAVHDGQTDRPNRCAQRVPQIYSQKALNLGWTPLAAWLPRTRSTEEDKPSAIHTAAWRNGVGLLRCCLGNDAYSFPPCTLATMLWQVPYLSKLNTARLVASFINSPCSTAATSSARLSESFFPPLSLPQPNTTMRFCCILSRLYVLLMRKIKY